MKEITLFSLICITMFLNIYSLRLIERQNNYLNHLVKFTLSASIKADEAGLRTDELYTMLEEIENEKY